MIVERARSSTPAPTTDAALSATLFTSSAIALAFILQMESLNNLAKEILNKRFGMDRLLKTELPKLLRVLSEDRVGPIKAACDIEPSEMIHKVRVRKEAYDRHEHFCATI